MPHRWVLDTNVVASALLWGRTPREIMQAARQRRVTLFTSAPLLAELTNILARRKFEKKILASGFTIDQLVDRYVALTNLVRPVAVSGIAPDPDDDVVIGTALAAKAEFIVTGDEGLLSVAEYRGIQILTIRQTLAVLTP
jgi:uncharacterized protein